MFNHDYKGEEIHRVPARQQLRLTIFINGRYSINFDILYFIFAAILLIDKYLFINIAREICCIAIYYYRKEAQTVEVIEPRSDSIRLLGSESSQVL